MFSIENWRSSGVRGSKAVSCAPVGAVRRVAETAAVETSEKKAFMKITFLKNTGLVNTAAFLGR